MNTPYAVLIAATLLIAGCDRSAAIKADAEYRAYITECMRLHYDSDACYRLLRDGVPIERLIKPAESP